MGDSGILFFVLIIFAILSAMILLPIIALVVSIRTRSKLNEKVAQLETGQSASGDQRLYAHVQQLTARVAQLEALAGATTAPEPLPVTEPAKVGPGRAAPPATAPPAPQVSTPPPPTVPPSTPPPLPIDASQLESIIGRRWLGWAAVTLILFAAAFFLKYAFDNRWIGELGRVAIGVAAGITLCGLGYRYHRRKWRVFSQILTGGGVVILYLSAYASFGYYHLATEKAAFVYMALLIAEAAALALLYDAPAIAVMALLGGFLVPVLLRSDRDQYRSFFTYIAALDAGALALMKHWPGLSSLAFLGTHLLFWMWYDESYHPQKLTAVMVFQTAIFFMFLLAHLARRIFRGRALAYHDLESWFSDVFNFAAGSEDFLLVVANPFVFFATAYYFLNPNHHEWMGALAIGMALVYAGAAKLLLDRARTTRTELLLMIGVALTFVTLAIPIQLKSNWIAIAWAIEGLLVLWAGIEMLSVRLRTISHLLFSLSLLKLVFFDTPWLSRADFTPVLNKYFLSSLFVVACLFAGAWMYQRLGAKKQIAARVFQIVLLIVAISTLWFVLTIETHGYFAMRAAKLRVAEDYLHEKWLGQMALSVLWSLYAAILAAVGFIRRTAAIRWVALSLFALTVIKVMLVDIAMLEQLYRIIAFLVLGLLLLVVTWGYHRAFHSRE